MDFRDFWTKYKVATRSKTVPLLERIHDDDLNWRPAEDALSIGETLKHIWMSEEGVARVALDADFSYYEARLPQGLKAVLGEPRSLAEEVADLERVHNLTLQRVSEAPPQVFEEERVHEGFGFRRKVFTILMGIVEHEIHHRAQLMTCLRLRGRGLPEPRSFRA